MTSLPTEGNSVLLGLDVGGTAAKAVIVRNGKIIGEGRGGPGNFDEVPVAVVRGSIGDAVSEARANAGVGHVRFDAAVLGVAGVVSETDKQLVRDIIAPLSLAAPERIDVVHDCRIALEGALSGRPGIVLIAGTGSASYGRSTDGHEWLAGHWGSLVGDEGSSYRVAVAAIRAVTCAVDGRGPRTRLEEPILGRLQITDTNDLSHRLHVAGITHRELAALAVTVAAVAREGDEVALKIFRDAARELAQAARAVADKLGFVEEVEIATVGGLFSSGDLLAKPLLDELRSTIQAVQLVTPELSPAQGAALLAARLVG